MNLFQVAFFVFLSLMLASCEDKDSKLVPLDLLSEGLSLKINAPEGVVVTTNDLILMKIISIMTLDMQKYGEKNNL